MGATPLYLAIILAWANAYSRTSATLRLSGTVNVFIILADNLGFRSSYDRIIRCMGLKFDFSIFSSPDQSSVGEYDKYPNLLSTYE